MEQEFGEFSCIIYMVPLFGFLVNKCLSGFLANSTRHRRLTCVTQIFLPDMHCFIIFLIADISKSSELEVKV